MSDQSKCQGLEILQGEIFLSDGGKLRRSDFDHSNIFQN